MKTKILKEVKNIIYNACLYFTIAVFVLMIAFTIASQNESFAQPEKMLLSPKLTGIIFSYSFVMAFLNLIWKIKYSVTIKLLLHFIGSLAAFAVFFIFMLENNSTVESTFLRALIFTVVYFVIAIIALIIGSIRKSRKNTNADYDSQFKKNK
ncbi:MAG: DUF3021 family protein [Clostridia bacterium]|nr:DUF3021 family protein [Clostridia bacterium]